MCLIDFHLQSFSFQIEYLCVVNYSKQNIIVDLEFNAGVAVEEKNYFLTQTVGDLTLRVKDRLGLRGNNVIKPNISQDLYECNLSRKMRKKYIKIDKISCFCVF